MCQDMRFVYETERSVFGFNFPDLRNIIEIFQRMIQSAKERGRLADEPLIFRLFPRKRQGIIPQPLPIGNLGVQLLAPIIDMPPIMI